MNEFGKVVAIGSFVIGTLLMIIYYFFEPDKIVLFSIYFIIFAAIINGIILLILNFKYINEIENRKPLLKTIVLILSNIPIAIGYFFFILFLLNTMRINFINDTGIEIRNMKITGCENRFVDRIAENEKIEKWITIKPDCRIQIEYEIEGEIKSEIVNDYIITGHRMDYKITRN
jgi:vacuolar-type H+-ATPase subunit I/STV1